MTEFEQEMLDKYDDETYVFTDEDIEAFIWEFDEVEEIEGDNHRWQQEVSTICEVGGRYFRTDWMRGLTECQDHDFYDSPVEVKPETKVVTETITMYKVIK